MKLKRLCIAILVFSVILCLVPQAGAKTVAPFPDADEITYTEAVDLLAGLRVLKGRDTGYFDPLGNINRAEMAAIIYRMVTRDVSNTNTHLYEDRSYFSDVSSGQWFAGYINFCAEHRIILGYDNGCFGPGDPVNGVQAMAMIMRALGYGMNGEFSGAGWDSNVLEQAKALNIGKNVTADAYQPAKRQEVAEYVFSALSAPKCEAYTAHPWFSAPVDSLADIFGLKCITGVVSANSFTGISAVGDKNGAAIAAAFTGTMIKSPDGTSYYLDEETSADLIGHTVRVWCRAVDAPAVYSIAAPIGDANTQYVYFSGTKQTVYSVKDISTKTVRAVINGKTGISPDDAYALGFTADRIILSTAVNGVLTSSPLLPGDRVTLISNSAPDESGKFSVDAVIVTRDFAYMVSHISSSELIIGSLSLSRADCSSNLSAIVKGDIIIYRPFGVKYYSAVKARSVSGKISAVTDRGISLAGSTAVYPMSGISVDSAIVSDAVNQTDNFTLYLDSYGCCFAVIKTGNALAGKAKTVFADTIYTNGTDENGAPKYFVRTVDENGTVSDIRILDRDGTYFPGYILQSLCDAVPDESGRYTLSSSSAASLKTAEERTISRGQTTLAGAAITDKTNFIFISGTGASFRAETFTGTASLCIINETYLLPEGCRYVTASISGELCVTAVFIPGEWGE